MIVLGLDISTRCTGICVLHGDERKVSYVRGDKDGWSIFDKAVAVRDDLVAIKTMYGKPDKIVIEQSITRMRKGMSSAHTINLLSRYNGIISWVAYQLFDMEPQFVDAREARKALGIEIKRGDDAKEKVMDFLVANYNFGTVLGRTGRIVPWYYDMADATVMALYGQLNIKEKEGTNDKKDSRKKGKK